MTAVPTCALPIYREAQGDGPHRRSRGHCRRGDDAARRRCPLGDRTGDRGQRRARALMALMTEKLRAIMALDPDRIELDFEGRDYSWRQIADAVRAIEDALGAMGLPEDRSEEHTSELQSLMRISYAVFS